MTEYKSKKALKIFKAVIIVFVIIFVYSSIVIQRAKKGNISSSGHIAVVFGAAIKNSGKLFGAILYRTQSAISLYKSGKIKKIIFSGSDQGYRNIGEATAMRLYARRKGIPEKNIFTDRNGDNTRKSVQNVNRIILNLDELKKYKKTTIFISHDYHLARIELLAKRYGFEGFTYPALGKPLEKEMLFFIREVFAYTYTLFFEWP